jgi:hypothetical protein
VLDLVDALAEGRPRLVSMSRKLFRREQESKEEDGCEADDEEPLHADAKLGRVLESEVRTV